MFGILQRGILNTKVIDHKARYGVSVVMDLHARCLLYVMIPKWSHMFHQLLVNDNTGLFESTHALLNTYVDPPLVVYQCRKVVRINDFLWGAF